MLKYLIASILAMPTLFFAQNTDSTEIQRKMILKDLSDQSCSCIDSIRVSGKDHKEISKEIYRCIADKVNPYNMMVKLSTANEKIEKDNSTEKKTVNITMNMDENSAEFKEAYFEIERYLNRNCSAIRSKAAVYEKTTGKSISDNAAAVQLYNEGLDAEKSKDYKKAIRLFEKALAKDDQFAFAWDNLGFCYRQLGELDKAIKSYKKSIEIDPMGKMPLQNLAVAYIYKQDFPSAINTYLQLQKIDPQNPEVNYGIGNVYLTALKDSEKALDYLCKAYVKYIELNSPYRTDAEYLIQNAYSDLKKNGKEAFFEETLKKNKISMK